MTAFSVWRDLCITTRYPAWEPIAGKLQLVVSREAGASKAAFPSWSLGTSKKGRLSAKGSICPSSANWGRRLHSHALHTFALCANLASDRVKSINPATIGRNPLPTVDSSAGQAYKNPYQPPCQRFRSTRFIRRDGHPPPIPSRGAADKRYSLALPIHFRTQMHII